MYRWSTQHAWVNRAKSFDAALAGESAEQHSAAYHADLERHRRRAAEAGDALYVVASKILQQLNAELASLELTPATLGVLLRAFVVSLDLSAHALGIDALLERQQIDTPE